MASGAPCGGTAALGTAKQQQSPDFGVENAVLGRDYGAASRVSTKSIAPAPNLSLRGWFNQRGRTLAATGSFPATRSPF